MAIPELSDRIETALNESRMLLLGGQVLLGFSYRICFEQGFERLPHSGQLAEVVSLSINTAVLGWLIWPSAFHQIAERGVESEIINTVITRVLDWALLPFAVGLGLGLYPVIVSLHVAYAAPIAAFFCVFALALWYGSLVARDSAKPQNQDTGNNGGSRGTENQDQDGAAHSDLSTRIKEVLMECRMALPGAQAFLGFQFAIVFAQGFEQIPRSSQLVHFISLLSTTVSIVLLIAPAAFHRLAERGRDTERFHRVASRLLLSALIFLAPGMAGELFIVIRKVTDDALLSIIVSGVLLLGFYVLWFGVSILRREHGEAR